MSWQSCQPLQGPTSASGGFGPPASCCRGSPNPCCKVSLPLTLSFTAEVGREQWLGLCRGFWDQKCLAGGRQGECGLGGARHVGAPFGAGMSVGFHGTCVHLLWAIHDWYGITSGRWYFTFNHRCVSQASISNTLQYPTRLPWVSRHHLPTLRHFNLSSVSWNQLLQFFPEKLKLFQFEALCLYRFKQFLLWKLFSVALCLKQKWHHEFWEVYDHERSRI